MPLLAPAPPALPASPVTLLRVAEARIAHPRLHADIRYLRVRRGVYAPRDAWTALAPWHRYLARVHAFALTRPDAAFCLESAAVLRGLPIFGEPRYIHVYDPGRSASRSMGDVRVHTSADARVVERVGDLFATSVADTAVDLVRMLPPAFGLAVADAAISAERAGAASLALLESLASDQANPRGRRRLEVVLPMADGRAESAGESVSRAVARWLGYEDPELQVEFVTDGYVDRVDFWFESVRAIGESDGYGKYVATDQAQVVARVIDEKRREDRLRRRSSAFTRWDWAAAIRVDPLDRRLAEMRVPRVRPAQPALLGTVGANPRSLPREKPASR